MKEGKSIRFAMLVSPDDERQKNSLKIKEQIPTLEFKYADIRKDDLFQTHLELLRTDSQKYIGVVMMEDDVVLCKKFYERITSVINEHSHDVIQFFERALAKNPLKRGYANGSEFYSCVCYYVPSDLTKLICDKAYVDYFKNVYYPQKNEKWTYPIDTYIQFFLKYNKLKYWREFPFLVQHSDFKSMLGPRSRKRQSLFFIDNMENKNADKYTARKTKG